MGVRAPSCVREPWIVRARGLVGHEGWPRAGGDLPYELCMDAVEGQRPLRRVLVEDPRVSPYLGPAEPDALLDPARYTGLAAQFVDRVAPP